MKKLIMVTLCLTIALGLISSNANASKVSISNQRITIEKISSLAASAEFLLKSKVLICFGPFGCIGWDIETSIQMPASTGNSNKLTANQMTVVFDSPTDLKTITVNADAVGTPTSKSQYSSVTILHGTYSVVNGNTVVFNVIAK